MTLRIVANQLIGEGGGRECGFSGLGWMQLLTQPFSHTLYRLKHPSCGMPLSTFNFVLKKKISQLLTPKFRDKLVTLLEWFKKKGQEFVNFRSRLNCRETYIFTWSEQQCWRSKDFLFWDYLQICLAQCVSYIEVTPFSAACIKCSFW